MADWSGIRAGDGGGHGLETGRRATNYRGMLATAAGLTAAASVTWTGSGCGSCPYPSILRSIAGLEASPWHSFDLAGPSPNGDGWQKC